MIPGKMVIPFSAALQRTWGATTPVLPREILCLSQLPQPSQSPELDPSFPGWCIKNRAPGVRWGIGPLKASSRWAEGSPVAVHILCPSQLVLGVL